MRTSSVFPHCEFNDVVAQLEGMVTDMNLSSDMQIAFADDLRDKDIKLETDLSVQARTRSLGAFTPR